MKAAITFLIILSIHTASTFPRCGRPRFFTGELERSFKLFMDVLGYKPRRDFNRAHVVPWEAINKNFFEKDPSFSLFIWTAKVDDLIHDLHFIDDEWFGNKILQNAPQEWAKYISQNNNNEKKCKGYLGKIDESQIQQIVATNKLTKKMNDLCRCLFSAPANIRPGYIATNNLIGSFFDPLTTSKPTKNKVIKCNDITGRSQELAKKYNLFSLQYKRQYRGGGIATSDQSPKVPSKKKSLQKQKLFTMIQC